VGLGVQLAGALDLAAAANVIGGALHPRDVLVSPDEARLTGLGIAGALERVGVAAPVRRPYAAPERVAGGKWDRRADIFSLAAILHEMLWGRRVVGQGQQVADSLTELPGADLKALRRVFARALAEDPADRFETALQLAGALKEAFPGVDQGHFLVESAPMLPLEAPAPTGPGADIDLRVPDSRKYHDLEPEAAIMLPDIEPPTEPQVPLLHALSAEQGPATPRPPGGLLDLHAQETGGSPLERSRSAIWPLALALLVGLALGFAGGYGVGSRDRVVPSAGAPGGTAPTSDAAAARSAAPAREWTEGTVKPRVEPKADRRVERPVSRPAAPPIVATGHLLVRSTPAGARVFVDGRDRGATPAAIRDLTQGPHSLRVVREGYATEERRVVISPSRSQQSMSLNLTRTRAPETVVASASGAFFGSLAVESRPVGASVFVDGRVVGTTPMMLPQIGAGSHVIRLEHDGYRRWSSSVRVVSGERNRVTASLER
jgi:hypothetical protein